MNNTKPTILIIGGTGCLSSALVQECLLNNFEITILNRGKRKELIPKGVSLIQADKNDIASIEQLIVSSHFDTIVDFLSYNVSDLKKSINLYHSHCNQFIFISSCAVYDKRKTTVCDEDSPKVDKRWNYSVEKWACEELLKRKSVELNFNYTIIRPSMTFGNTRIPYGIMPQYGWHGTLIQRILHGKPIITWGSGDYTNNIMRVEDFCRAFVLLINNKDAYNNAFNICGEKTYTYEQVLQSIERKLGKKAIRHNISSADYAKLYPEKAGEIIAGRSGQSTCIRRNFQKLFPDFKEEISLDDGISRTIDAYYQNNFMRGIDYTFDGNCDRIILRTSPKKSQYTIGFIDYLNKRNKSDQQAYKKALTRDKLWSKIKSYLAFCFYRITR